LKIGVIGAGGWLGGAIVESMLLAGITVPETLSLSYRSKRPDRFQGANWTTDNQAVADRSDVIIVSVRPQDWPSVAVSTPGKLVISVMAGVPLATLCERHGTERVVRSLPNAAAEVRNSYTPWVASDGVNEGDRAAVRAIFGACGVQDEVTSESDIDYLTGLTGSGPVFPALLATAMMKHAISHGVSPEMARRAVNMVLVGAGRLIELHGDAPENVVETFLDYRGTTAAAIDTMRLAGFEQAVARGLMAVFEESLSIGSS
jgi:pyrroline-5-carboxylate reductase